jgi:hypothetical protein
MRRLDRADALPLLGALPVLAIFAWWTADEGGYTRAAWMPGLVVVAIVLGMAIALAPRRPSRPAMLAIAALAAYTAWSFASILWADAPGPALDGSQRTLLYLVCFASFALLPWTPRALLVVLGCFALLAVVSGAVVAIRVAQAADPARFFFEGRLVGPLGYPNASAAWWMAGAVVALGLAARPEVVAWLRPLFLSATGFLLCLIVTTESRGWLFTLPVVMLAVLALVPGRARTVLFAAPVAVALALASGDLLSVYRSVEGLQQPALAGTLNATFDDAVRAMLLTAGALVAVGALAVVVDALTRHRLASRPRLTRGLAAAVLVCAAVAGTGATLSATDGRPLERVDRAWTDFKTYDGEDADGTRFASLGTNRYEAWRVAFDAWREHPVGGLGQDNFAQTYIEQRRNTFGEPRWVHSLPLRLLAHTGAVGALLFVAFIALVLWAAVAGSSRCATRPGARAAGAIALLPAVVWIAHGSVDWLWEYPGLSGPAFALAGAVGALWRAPDGDEAATAGEEGATAAESTESRRRPHLRIALACFLVLACAAVVLPSYVADRDVRAAAGGWPADPPLAFDRLERARQLNPLDAQASLVEGIIAVRSGQLGQARTSFARAAAREPRDWYARFELGLIAGEQRARKESLRQLLAARRLNPLDPLVAQALGLARDGKAMSRPYADQVLARRSNSRVYMTEP